ncbi:aldehyde dehydrogenase family protein [Salipiger abyssi]|uniref:aldehyde dehydrogenase family protein n=1 Tax=Salipiger abyssi TaxID=1250539 RepID=UPI0040599225
MSLSFDPQSLSYPAGHFIGGARVDGPAALEVLAPSDGRVLSGIPVADAGTVDRAVTAAQAALDASGWAGLAPRARLRALHAWADLIDAEAETLARLESVASSRPVSQALAGDVRNTAEQIRFFAEFADKEGGDLVPTSETSMGFIASEPYGVVGAITPWNFPISMAGWKMGPALAAGNAVVLKPSEMTPFSTLYMAELSVRAGLPEGLINIVLGDGPVTGAALVAHPGIGKVSFTGSTRAGAAIMENIARTGIKPMTLELGGKSPQVVFADADLDLAAGCIARGIMANAGQVCVAGSRLIFAREVAEELAGRIAEKMAVTDAGPTWDEASGYSPIISEKQLGRIESIVSAARDLGAELICGGGRMDREGSFYQPTLLAGVDDRSPAVTEEIFGPVLTMQSFDEEEEAVALARHPTYGLCSGLFTRDLSRAMRMIRKLESGTVWVNRYGRSTDHILPTGGWKESGLGKDLGREAYLANRRSKSVLIDL